MGRGGGSLGFDPSAVRTGHVDTHIERERREYIVSLGPDSVTKNQKKKMLGSHEERVLMHKNIITTAGKDSKTLGWHGGHYSIAPKKNIPARVSSSNCLFSLGLRLLINNVVKDYCFKISSVIVLIFFFFFFCLWKRPLASVSLKVPRCPLQYSAVSTLYSLSV